METQNLKGWSMKQTDKTPFFEKEDGVFYLTILDRGAYGILGAGRVY
jgi:hypothetical protein